MSDYSQIQTVLAKKTLLRVRRDWLIRRRDELTESLSEADQARGLLLTDLEGDEGLEADYQHVEFLILLRSILGDAAEKWGDRQVETQVGLWLAMQECDARIRQLTRQRQHHLDSLKEYDSVEKDYMDTCAKKKATIEVDDGPLAEAIELDNEREKDLTLLVLLFEGIRAGKQAVATLIRLEQLLRVTSSEVAVSVVLDASAMALLGNDKLNHARLMARQAQVHIDNLEAELIALRQQCDDPPPFGGWAQFIDEWLDCFVFDVVDKKRLNESLRATKDVSRQVYGAIADLEARWKLAMMRLEGIAGKREQLGW
jgi:hypothetical protein